MTENSNLKKPGVAKTLLFSLIPALLLFAILETGARLLPPVKSPEEFPTKFMGDVAVFREDPLMKWRVRKALDKGYTLNSGGFRGREFPRGRKKPGETRIVALGDSTTWGMGVKDSQVWPALLEKTLRQKKIFADPVVLNAAVPGYTSFQGKLLLETEIMKYDPDVVITYFGVNDASSRYGMDRDSTWKLPSAQLAPVIRVLRKSAFYRDMTALWLKARTPKKKPGAPAEKEKYIQRVTPSEYKKNLEEIKKVAGHDTIFLNISPVWYFNGVASDEVQIVLFTKKQGSFTVTSMEGPLYVYEPSIKLAGILNSRGNAANFFLDYCHLTPEGHKIVADEAAAALSDMKNRKQ